MRYDSVITFRKVHWFVSISVTTAYKSQFAENLIWQKLNSGLWPNQPTTRCCKRTKCWGHKARIYFFMESKDGLVVWLDARGQAAVCIHVCADSYSSITWCKDKQDQVPIENSRRLKKKTNPPRDSRGTAGLISTYFLPPLWIYFTNLTAARWKLPLFLS